VGQKLQKLVKKIEGILGVNSLFAESNRSQRGISSNGGSEGDSDGKEVANVSGIGLERYEEVGKEDNEMGSNTTGVVA
jgi:hypothetical protein